MRVLVGDDHAPARAGVRRALAGAGFEVVAEAPDAASAVRLAHSEHPDVCLLEVALPGGGIAAAAEIAAGMPRVAVVMLTGSRADDDLFASLRAGAAGYLLKDTAPERLPHAIRGVLAGEAAVPRELVARLIDEFRDRHRRRTVAVPGRRAVELTLREWEVLELMRLRLSTAEIADRLGVAPVTVRTHVSAVLRKLEAPDREAAVGLLEGPSTP